MKPICVHSVSVYCLIARPCAFATSVTSMDLRSHHKSLFSVALASAPALRSDGRLIACEKTNSHEEEEQHKHFYPGNWT